MSLLQCVDALAEPFDEIVNLKQQSENDSKF